jgi:L-seryl-tRNA(Ser) seleniumtransferase
MRGPQATGILCGRRDLISSAALQMLDLDDHPELWEPPADFILRDRLPGLPRQGVGRALKVSKEQIAALLVALELFESGAYDAELPAMRRLESVEAALAGLPVRCRLIDPKDGESVPLLHVCLGGADAFAVCGRLRRGSPPVEVGHALLREGTLVINPLHLDDASTAVLARRLREELPS